MLAGQHTIHPLDPSVIIFYMTEDYQYNEWSGVEFPGDLNIYLGMTIDELFAQKEQISLALNIIDPERHKERFEGVIHKLMQVNEAIRQREN